MEERNKKCFDSIPNEGGYRDLIAQLNERERRDKITVEKEKRRECWKGSGKRKKNKHL